jgi:hypothetical protein
MKRISLVAITVLASLQGVAKAHHYGSFLYRTHYSPYAFSYKHLSGLIPGGLYYSPYASGLVPYGVRYSPYASGLVPSGVRYSPYAFSHGHSGLICDYSAYGFSYAPYVVVGSTCRGPAVADCGARRYRPTTGLEGSGSAGDMYSYREAKLRACKERIERLRDARKKIKAMRENDGKEIIYNYLKGKNIDFRMNRLLKIENKTLSVDFLLRDKNLIIKYWNPDEMQQAGYRKSICEKYQEEWRTLSQEFVANGGKIYEIESANREEILGKLDLCNQLRDG